MNEPKTTPYPLRLTEKLDVKIRAAKRRSGLKKPDVMRLALELGLPLVESLADGARRNGGRAA